MLPLQELRGAAAGQDQYAHSDCYVCAGIPSDTSSPGKTRFYFTSWIVIWTAQLVEGIQPLTQQKQISCSHETIGITSTHFCLQGIEIPTP